MFSKRQIFDLFLILLLASIVFLCGISQDTVGLWEPWETSTLLTAQHLSLSGLTESTFWVPRLDGKFVAQPYLELWSLMALLHTFSTPDAFILRLPGAITGIFLIVLTFFTVKQATTRRTAWMTSGILLTLPMFVFSGKFIHGDIWLILALALPNLFFILACYASTRRMQRAMTSLTSLSVIVSFLSGGLFALVILFFEGIISFLLIRKHPHYKFVIRPLVTRYFLLPLYISFVVCASIFGIYVTQARYELENRQPVTLSELNDALDGDRIVAIERRRNQIIGTFRKSNERNQNSFVLVESHESLNTNANDIFRLRDSQQRTFENYMMWRFQKKYPAKSNQDIPPIDEAFTTALRFFWFHTNTPYKESSLDLAKVSADAVAKTPLDAIVRTESEIRAAMGNSERIDSEISEISSITLHADEYVRILNNDPDSSYLEIQTGSGVHGFIPKHVVNITEEQSAIRWTSWIDVLVFGLLPWGCFFPIIIVCALISAQKLSLAPSPFKGEYVFGQYEEHKPLRSPLQSMLLSWFIVSIAALFIGINHNRHDIFIGLIPAAILLAIALTSPRFWRALRESLEARIGLIATAFVSLIYVIIEFKHQPYMLVRYLMTDPLMHWDSSSQEIFTYYIAPTICFCIIFFVLVLLSFTGAAEAIQEKIEQWRTLHKQPAQSEIKSTSSTTLMRISRGENEPIPYAPAISLLTLGTIFSIFIYFSYLPSISDNFTETSLIHSYFELANQSEPVYLLSGENTQLCQTYKDCEPGYVCQSSHCRISVFSSYSLNVARPISKSDMLDSFSPSADTTPAFYIIPKDALYNINQIYRMMYRKEDRRNLTVIDAPSTRLYLIGTHSDIPSINPFDKVFMTSLPENATKSALQLSSEITLEGFRLENLDFERTKTLSLTLYYRILAPLKHNHHFEFSFKPSNRTIDFQRSLLNGKYDTHQLIPGDLVADTFNFELPTLPNRGYMELMVSVNQTNISSPLQPLTTINY